MKIVSRVKVLLTSLFISAGFISTGLISTGTLAAEKPDSQKTEVNDLTVYLAKSIITMDDANPRANAVAVSNGKIVSVGSLESLKPWISQYKTTIDKSFEDKILMPGFIDPHVHPSLPAILTQFPFLAPDDWSIPTGEFPGAKNNKDYIVALKKQVAQYQQGLEQGLNKNAAADKTVPFVSWGFHQLWHGEVYRPKLDELFPNTPVILWHRSFHEIIANTAAIKLLGIQEEETKPYGHDINWQKGQFAEYGAKVVFLPKLMAKIFTPDKYALGMNHFVEMLHLGGVTSAMDMGIGIFGDPAGEIEMVKQAMADAPARIVLTPLITDFITRKVSPEDALKQVQQWQKLSNDKVMLDGHFKLMMDGAAFSGLGQMGFPGYIDGHEGVWMSPLETTYQYAETFWQAGYQLHAHANGDKSTEALIDIVDRLQKQHPRFDHRTLLEHFLYAKEDQMYRMAELGIGVSANPYYQYILADMYSKNWLGEDRGRNMSPLGGVKRAGMKLALHSDAPMAPLSPLTLVWTAVNRTTINGEQNAKTQALTLDEALKAVTIDAAWAMRKESSIGSIRAGKKADFVVLEQDPYKVNTKKIKDIEIWGTVFEGKPYPINK